MGKTVRINAIPFRIIGVFESKGLDSDGIDQDDMISFLGLHNAGEILNTGIGNAPPELRADTLEVSGVNLRFVNCPFSPFLDSREQAVCGGK